MPPRKKNSKRELENPGDISVSLAPAAPKKSKAPSRTTTRSSAKQATSDTADTNKDNVDLSVEPTASTDAGAIKKKRAHPKPKVPTTLNPIVEPSKDSEPTLQTTETHAPKAASTTAEPGKQLSNHADFSR